MTWKAKLVSITDDGLNVKYYDDASTQSFSEVYASDRFNTKPELQSYAAGVVANLNGKKTAANNAVNKFNSLVDTDIA